MIDEEYSSILKELGFTDRETKVYLALIELGSSTVGPIATKTNLQHTKVYETLDKLIEKNLVSYIVVSKTRHYQASEPKEILRTLDEKRKKFETILQDLENKQKNRDKQTAIVHEGQKAFKSFFYNVADMLKPGDYYYAFAFRDTYHNPTESLILKKFHEKLAEKKIDDRLLGHVNYRNLIKKNFEGNKIMKIRFTKNETPLGALVYLNKVAIIVTGEKTTVIEIASDQINQQYKRFFLDLWENAKE